MANAVRSPIRPATESSTKRTARFRIDGAVALAMALGLRSRDRAAQPAFDVMSLIG